MRQSSVFGVPLPLLKLYKTINLMLGERYSWKNASSEFKDQLTGIRRP
jgi:hypothetical protein